MRASRPVAGFGNGAGAAMTAEAAKKMTRAGRPTRTAVIGSFSLAVRASPVEQRAHFREEAVGVVVADDAADLVAVAVDDHHAGDGADLVFGGQVPVLV